MTPETPFEAASLTKPVVAYLAMLLVQDGRLDLDRSLDAYLPSPYLVEDPRAGGITARHVLSHTTGYRNWRSAREQRLVTEFAPGERFQYSGEGFYQLQVVIATLPVVRMPNAAGSLITTASDYARFLSVVVGDAPGPLRDDLRFEMFRRQVEIKPPALGWGLGWGLEKNGSRSWGWHWGDNPGYKNFVLADLEDRTALVIFTNGDGGRAVYERVVRAAGQDPAAFLWI